MFGEKRLPGEMAKHTLISLIVFASIFYSGDATAENSKCDVSIVGKIDERTIDNAISELEKIDPRFPTESATLCLDSPGGDLAQAIRFIEYMTEQSKGANGISTYVPRDANCSSSCSLILLSGFVCSQRFCYISRAMHRTATVGFHAPFLPGRPVQADRETLQEAYAAAVSAIKKISDSFSSEVYFQNSHLRLTAEMLVDIISTPPSEMYYLQTIGDLIKYKITPVGEYRVEKIDSDSFLTACDNSWLWQAHNSRSSLFGLEREVSFYSEKDPYRREKGTATIVALSHYSHRMWYICRLFDYKTESGAWQFEANVENGSISTVAEGYNTRTSKNSLQKMNKYDFASLFRKSINPENYWIFMNEKRKK